MGVAGIVIFKYESKFEIKKIGGGGGGGGLEQGIFFYKESKSKRILRGASISYTDTHDGLL